MAEMTDLELAREWLCTYLDMLEGLSPTKLNRDLHYNRLAALLARVRLSEAREFRLNDCHYHNTFEPDNCNCMFCERIAVLQ